MTSRGHTLLCRLLIATTALVALVGLGLLLHHVAHCESEQGDCTICKLAGAFLLVVVAGSAVMLSVSGRCLAALNAVRLMIGLSAQSAVRAPPVCSSLR